MLEDATTTGAIYFTVNPDGSVSYPASEDGLLSVQGTDELIVLAPA